VRPILRCSQVGVSTSEPYSLPFLGPVRMCTRAVQSPAKRTGYDILLDCGPHTLMNLIKTGVSCHRITHILSAHFHADYFPDFIACFRCHDPHRASRRETTAAHMVSQSLYLRGPDGKEVDLTRSMQTSLFGRTIRRSSDRRVSRCTCNLERAWCRGQPGG